MQCHVLGVTLLPIVGALLVADVAARGRVGAGASLGRPRRSSSSPSCRWSIHELTTDFSEVRAALDYLAGGRRRRRDRRSPVRFVIIGLRVVAGRWSG